MIKKISLLICIMLISPVLFSLDYQPLPDSSGNLPGQQTSAITTSQKLDNLTLEQAKTQAQIQAVSDKLSSTATKDQLQELGNQMLRANEAQLNFYLLIFAIMQICVFLMAGAVYFIIKGKGRV